MPVFIPLLDSSRLSWCSWVLTWGWVPRTAPSWEQLLLSNTLAVDSSWTVCKQLFLSFGGSHMKEGGSCCCAALPALPGLLYSKPRTSWSHWDTSPVRLEPHLYRARIVISCNIWNYSVLLKTSFLQAGKLSWYLRRNTAIQSLYSCE